MSEYTTIGVKKDVVEKLKRATAILGTSAGKKVTVAGLISSLAEGMDSFVDADYMEQCDDWMCPDFVIPVNSDVAKHYRELKSYHPSSYMNELGMFIREQAMALRFKKIAEQEEKRHAN